jgi:hypothetical protein
MDLNGSRPKTSNKELMREVLYAVSAPCVCTTAAGDILKSMIGREFHSVSSQLLIFILDQQLVSSWFKTCTCVFFKKFNFKESKCISSCAQL